MKQPNSAKRKKWEKEYYQINKERLKQRSKLNYQKDRDKQIKLMKKYRAENKTYMNTLNRKSYFKTRYNLSVDDIEMLISMIDHRCQICNKQGPLDVDHCHQTGRVRGFLCRQCNMAIGLLKDNPLVIESAKKYLQERTL